MAVFVGDFLRDQNSKWSLFSLEGEVQAQMEQSVCLFVCMWCQKPFFVGRHYTPTELRATDSANRQRDGDEEEDVTRCPGYDNANATKV